MVIDSSAILAIYFDEPTTDAVLACMRSADQLVMSTVNLAEVLIRLHDRDPAMFEIQKRRLLEEPILFIPPDTAQATLAANARHRFPLNLGDCFAYALAKTQNLPLLTLDNDFRKTDVTVIRP